MASYVLGLVPRVAWTGPRRTGPSRTDRALWLIVARLRVCLALIAARTCRIPAPCPIARAYLLAEFRSMSHKGCYVIAGSLGSLELRLRLNNRGGEWRPDA